MLLVNVISVVTHNTASILCKLNRFRKTVKNLVTSRRIQVRTECEVT
jgi:hypothetical protein